MSAEIQKPKNIVKRLAESYLEQAQKINYALKISAGVEAIVFLFSLAKASDATVPLFYATLFTAGVSAVIDLSANQNNS